jgi:hypothetical protein
LRLIDSESGKVLVDAVEADGFLARVRGLIGRHPPRSGEGMILRTRQVHTFGMKFPIDAVYLRKDGSVLRVARLVPWRLGPLQPRARWVLELAADDAARLGIRKGVVLEMRQ